jgi:hypothetical protein
MTSRSRGVSASSLDKVSLLGAHYVRSSTHPGILIETESRRGARGVGLEVEEVWFGSGSSRFTGSWPTRSVGFSFQMRSRTAPRSAPDLARSPDAASSAPVGDSGQADRPRSMLRPSFAYSTSRHNAFASPSARSCGISRRAAGATSRRRFAGLDFAPVVSSGDPTTEVLRNAVVCTQRHD